MKQTARIVVGSAMWHVAFGPKWTPWRQASGRMVGRIIGQRTHGFWYRCWAAYANSKPYGYWATRV